MKRSTSVLINITLIAASLAATLFLLEFGFRIFMNIQESREMRFSVLNYDLLSSSYPVLYHDVLGWTPQPGSAEEYRKRGIQVTINDEGIRSNGNNMDRPSRKATILAAGDSFTFGDEVSDHETWPAYLESSTSYRVINAGVFGYGIDQTILRAELLSEKYRPDILVISFVSDDIFRTALSKRTGAFKPFFSLSDEKLVLNNVPVPRKGSAKLFFRRLLGKSHLVNFLMLRLYSSQWLSDTLLGTTEEHDDALDVSKALLQRIEDFSVRNNIRLMVLAQYTSVLDEPERASIRYALSGLNEAHTVIVDPYFEMKEIKDTKPYEYASFFVRDQGHMSPEGNAFIARQLSMALERNEPVLPTPDLAP